MKSSNFKQILCRTTVGTVIQIISVGKTQDLVIFPITRLAVAIHTREHKLRAT